MGLPTAPEPENLFFLMARLVRRWRQVLDAEIYAAIGLTDAAWRPLLHLTLLGDGARQKDLASSLGIEGPSLVHLLDNLVARGLVLRQEHSSDRRANELHLTPAGQHLVTRVQKVLVPLEKEISQHFTAAELAGAVDFIQQLGAAVEELKHRKHPPRPLSD